VAPKPVPVAVIRIPAAPWVGFNERLDVTVKVTDGEKDPSLTEIR
jgi:hypothetical protein